MIELNYEHAKIIRRTERRVSIILFIFAVLFGGLLFFVMFGCTDSQEQKVMDDVRIYEILPDGTKIDVTDKFPPSEGWEYKETHE